MLFYLSFADAVGFLGAAIVEAPTAYGASSVAWAHGCNPGGEVSVVEVDRSIPDEWRNRLLTREDVQQLDVALCAARH